MWLFWSKSTVPYLLVLQIQGSFFSPTAGCHTALSLQRQGMFQSENWARAVCLVVAELFQRRSMFQSTSRVPYCCIALTMRYVSIQEQGALLLGCFKDEVCFSPRIGCLVAGLFQRRGMVLEQSTLLQCRFNDEVCFSPRAGCLVVAELF